VCVILNRSFAILDPHITLNHISPRRAGTQRVPLKKRRVFH
jgi:hypothetical protein